MSTAPFSIDGSDHMSNVDLNSTELTSPSGVIKNVVVASELSGKSENFQVTSDFNQTKNGGPQRKKNWVQFDDEEEEQEESVGNNRITSSSIAPVSGVSQVNASFSNDKKAAATTATSSSVANVNVETSTSPIHRGSQISAPSTAIDIAPAVLATESVHVSLNSASSSPQKPNMVLGSSNLNDIHKNLGLQANNNSASQMRTIELSTGRIREGFANGDLIVTLLPTNTRWPWITPAIFRPELVPEELMAQGLTLTVEEYVNAMETLVNDYRFTVYNICYKRVLVCWILFAFCVLLALLFSGLQGIALFSLGVGWLFLNAAAIFFCMWIKLRLSRGLEKCLARVNKQLVRHKLLLVLDDRGRISCHKVNLCFLYFDPAQCIAYLNDYIERNEQSGNMIESGWEQRLDLEVNDIVIQGSNPTRLSRKQERGLLLYLRYGSRWGNEIVRGLGDVTSTEPARHCAQYICPCQYIERHLSCKPRGTYSYYPSSPHNSPIQMWSLF